MSPRAACRFEEMEFEEVYDYVGGIADWKGAGLEVEGDAPPVQVAADATRPDIPTAAPDELLGEVHTRTVEAGWDEAIVVDCGGLVVGRLRGRSWEGDSDMPVANSMEAGPTTVRPDAVLARLVGRMADRGTKLVVVSTPQGALVGVLLREEAERIVSGEPPELVWRDCEGCPGRWAPK